jgi:hypothetical protein
VTSLPIPSAVVAAAQRAADTYRELTGVAVDATTLLAGRAGLVGHAPQGRVSAGGATRLLPCRDGWCALTLSRADDIAAIPALLSADDIDDDPWPAVQRWVAGTDCAEVTGRARLLGLPVAGLAETRPAEPRHRPHGVPGRPRDLTGLLVADLSVMWAGPLCGQLLRAAGATVVKVETAARPDGARFGPAAFFDWMNGGKLCYAADFDDPSGLRALLSAADVVIESSRPAALARRGLGPDQVTPRDGRVWLRITGHGTEGERANWVAFGDDAAVSGGLVLDGPAFCGDAIADPLTGLHAAVEVARSLRGGGGELIELSMSGIAARYGELPRDQLTECRAVPRPDVGARALGADNAVVERLIGSHASC